jgi:oligopeptide transport system substrate-binding protein
LHRQAASALKQSRPGAFARLARHYREAGHLDQGIDYLLQAGNEARMLHSHQEAIDCYRQASDHYLEVGDYRRVSSVLFRLALTYHNAFEFEKSREAYDRAFSMLQRSASVQVAGSVLAPHPFRFASHEPLTLDPTRVHESFSWVFIHQLFRGLVEERPDTGVVPDIASSWEVKEGGTKYVFHLRPDARWTDGEPITSNDFGYAWRRVLEPGGGSPLAALLYDIKGAKDYHQVGPTYADTLGIITPDPHTLVVELESPANYFLSILAQPTAYPVPQRTIEAYGESWTTPGRIVTNGPFRLDRWVNGRLMTMDRDRSVPGGSIGNVDRLEILLYSGDGSHLLGEYEKDQLDMLLLDRMPIEVHEVARQRHASEYISTPLLETTFIFFDVHRAPFDDRRVRQAFARAVDRERIANLDMHGLVSPATGSFVPPGIPGHFTGASGSYDPDVARRLLAKAGFAGGKGFPTLQVPVAFEFFQGTALKALCQRWEETLGVEITPKELPFEAYMERLRVDPPMVGIAGWLADYPDPYNFLNFQGGVFWWTSNPWRDERYDQLVQTGRLTMDLTARLEYYRQAEAILAVEVPLLPINYHRMSLLLKPWISAFPISMTGNTYFIKDAVIEQH